jgi:hypothetical protein
MPMLAHDFTLCTSCIALFNCGHLLHIHVDHVEPKTDIQPEQVQWVFGDLQATICEDTNIA